MNVAKVLEPPVIDDAVIVPLNFVLDVAVPAATAEFKLKEVGVGDSDK